MIRSRGIRLCMFLGVAALACQEPSQVVCGNVVGILVNQLSFGTPLSETARVELRQCGENVTEELQIVAWEANAVKPSLVIDTTDFTVVQTAGRQNIYVIETTGGPRDRIYVILYQ